MGLLDNLKQNAENLTERAKEGLASAKDRAADFAGDVRERMDDGDQSEDPVSTVDTAADHAPDGLDDATSAAAGSVGAAAERATDGMGQATNTASDRVNDAIDTTQERADTTPGSPGDNLGSDAYVAPETSEGAIDAVQQRADDLRTGPNPSEGGRL